MIVGILLAAGESRRFGVQKLLHPLADGTPMALQSALNLSAALPTSIAVVSPQGTAIAEIFTHARIPVCTCERSSEGMGASLACGVRAAPDARGWIVALADMPFIEPHTIRAVAQALAAGAKIAAPVHEGRRGHPVGFARDYYAELAALGGDEGARRIVARDQDRVALVPVADPGVHRDIDTREDLSA